MATSDDSSPFQSVSPFASVTTPDVWPPPEWETAPAPLLDPAAFPIPSDFAPRTEPEMEFSEADDLAMLEQAQRDDTPRMEFSEADDLAMVDAAEEEYPPRRWNSDEQASADHAPPSQEQGVVEDSETAIDAVSGGRLPPPEPYEEPTAPINPYGNPDELQASPESGEELVDMYSRMTPESYAAQVADEDEAKRQHFAKRNEEILAADREAQRGSEARLKLARNETTRQANELRQDIDTHSKATIDPGRWMESRTGLQKAAAYLSVMIGGWESASHGGRNRSLEGIMKAIDQDIASQRHEIANQRQSLSMRKNMIGELRTRNNDEHQADESARVIRLRQAAAMVGNEAERYHPAGTAARRAIAAKQGILAEANARQAAMEEKIYEREMDNAELDIKQHAEVRMTAKTQLEMDIRKAEFDRKARARSGPRRTKEPSLSDKIKAEQNGFVWNGQTFVKDPNFKPPEGETKGQSAARKEQAMADKYERENSQYEQQRLEQVGLSGIKTKDGKQIYAGDKGEAAKYRSLKSALDTSTSLLDDIAIAYEDHGMEFFGSAEGKAMTAKANAALLEIKTVAELGVLAGPDMGIVEGMLGSDDFNKSVRDPTAAIRSTQRYMKDKYNNQIHSLNEDAAPYNPPRKHKAVAAERTPEELKAAVTQGVPKAFAGDEMKSQEALGEMRASAERLSKHHNPPESQIGEIGANVKKLVETGNISQEMAASTLEPLAINLARHEKERVERMTPAQLADLQKDPKRVRRLKLANEVLSGRATAIYEFVAGPTELVLEYKGRPQAPRTGMSKETQSAVKAFTE